MTTSTCAAACLLVAGTLACADNGDATKKEEIPIACVLDALDAAGRAREGVLLQEHLGAVLEVHEEHDGFLFRYPPDPALFTRMAELVALEHQCCPFLDFQLEWGAGNSEPWLHVAGGERVKSFVADTFVPPDKPISR